MIMNDRRSKMAYSTILCIITFIKFGISSCMGTSDYQSADVKMMTWYDSAANCSLVSNENLPLLDSNYEGWVGGIYLKTSWMTYKGCVWDQNDEFEHIKLEDNSPALCSLLCKNHHYIGLKEKLCACLDEQDLQPTNEMNCDQKCSRLDSWVKCGSSTENYFSTYKLAEGPFDRLDTFEMCIVAKTKCEEDEQICANRQALDNIVAKVWKNKNISQNCRRIDDDFNNKTYWRSFRRFFVLIWLKQTMVMTMINRNLTCLLGISNIENEKNLRCAFVNKSETPELRKIPCNNRQPHNCRTDHDNNISDLFLETCILEKTASSFTNTNTKHITNDRQQYTLSTEKEITFVENSSIGYNTTVANNTLLVEYYDPVFVIQMGITLGACAMVMVSAIIACCILIKNRSEENIVIAIEGPPQHTILITALAENYFDPIDKASTSNEIEGPRFCATESCQNTNCQRTENGEYQHLDFTLRSEPTPRFADNNEYDHVHGRANVVSVFEQPWDTATSKVNKLFSQISKSVVQKSQNMRKSLIKRRASRSGSPKLKCRASDYCDAWKTQLNNQQFVFDSDADNQSDISIEVANSTVDSNKDGPEFRRTDSAFPVLPYSERINVKSTHIYDEPDDRRMSLRERLLHMISMRPLKMPFGIELDLRGSRSKSKIYSLATPIDETDESVA